MVNIEFRIKQFNLFYDLLMKETPIDYIPWFFPCEKNGKNPSAIAILNINPSSKGSWHHKSARLNKEQCIEHIKQGYNIGISARENDSLVIIDIDDSKYLEQTIPNTLTSTSRKRSGTHSFAWASSKELKINFPTDSGEIRSNNQYVLSPGSYVPFGDTEKEKKAFDKLPDWAKADSLLGYYTVRTEVPVRTIVYDEIPLFFREEMKRDVEETADVEHRNEKLSYEKKGKYSQLFSLKMSDLLGKLESKKRFGHPLHESDSDANFSLSKDGSIAHCWRHMVSLNPVQFLCVFAGYKSCQDAGTPHKGRGISKIKGDKEAYKIAYDEAVKRGIIGEYKEETSLREKVLSCLHKKDIATATEILVKEIEKENHIFTTKDDNKQEVLVYSQGIYKENGESEIKDQLRKILLDDYNEWIANQVMAKIKVDTFIDQVKLFEERNIYEIPVQNGILNIQTLELQNFTPEKIYFFKIPVDYIEGATCPMIDNFLSEVLSNPEDKDVFYEIAGFGLLRDYFLEKAFMFVGSGRNGKGKSIELLKRLVGMDNCTSVPLSSINSNSPFIMKLWRKLFNLAGDISSKDLKETGMFKQLTGRDLISANRKYKTIIDFTNYAKMIFACNELPRVYDYSDGFWERWVLIEFPYKFVEQNVYDSADNKSFLKIKDPNIIEKITTPEEMSGFLNMALLGLHRLFRNKKCSYTKGTAEVKNKWIRMSNSFMAFCMDKLEGDWHGKITKKEIRQKYNEYCKQHRVSGVSDISIKVTLQELFGVIEGYSTFLGYEGQQYCWEGLKWKI